LTIIAAVSKNENLSFFNVLTTFLAEPGIIFIAMKDTFDWIDLLFYAIAVYEGYKFSFRSLSADEIASVQKPQTPNQV
jgi:hypothetical protein